MHKKKQYFFKNYNMTPLDITMDYPKFIVSTWREESIGIQKVKQDVTFSCSKLFKIMTSY